MGWAMLQDFLVIISFVFILSAIILALTTKAPSALPQTRPRSDEGGAREMELEDLIELIHRDKVLTSPEPPVEVPHIELPGARLGGGAKGETCSKASFAITLKLNEDPNERRKYNRRLRDRRVADQPVEEDRRLIQRRVWLRREEDRRGKTLLSVTDAANTLGVTVEQIYKWLDDSDIPFYQVTEGKRKAIRFEINELVQWHSAFASQGRNPRRDA